MKKIIWGEGQIFFSWNLIRVPTKGYMPTFRSLGPIIKIFRKIGVMGEEGETHLGGKKVEYMKKGYLRISFANFQHSTCSIDFSGIFIKFGGGLRRPPCTPLTKNLKSDNAILNSLLLSTK